MRRSTAVWTLGWLLGAAFSAQGQRRPADAGVEEPAQRPAEVRGGSPAEPSSDDPKFPPNPKKSKSPTPPGNRAPRAATGESKPGAGAKAKRNIPKKPSKAPADEDREVIRHLEMLLLMDLLRDYEIFDDEADATFPEPKGLKEYRP